MEHVYKRNQWEAFRLQQQLTKDTGIHHSTCDGCHHVAPGDEMEYLGDEHNVFLILCKAECHGKVTEPDK